ncbi:hypothetical protein M3Y99_00662700 [Aphelenchoides fujianensis]|nr:hypothetical protein M3Y99_00662700 [Aphelenchoides fujianensis]
MCPNDSKASSRTASRSSTRV